MGDGNMKNEKQSSNLNFQCKVILKTEEPFSFMFYVPTSV